MYDTLTQNRSKIVCITQLNNQSHCKNGAKTGPHTLQIILTALMFIRIIRTIYVNNTFFAEIFFGKHYSVHVIIIFNTIIKDTRHA